VRQEDWANLGITLVAFAIFIGWPEIRGVWKNIIRLRQLRLKLPRPSLHHVWQGIVVVATLIGLLGGVDYFFGRPWPTDPEIHPHESVAGSSLRLPFTIRNKSLWPMNNVAMTCGIDVVLWEDAAGRRGGAAGIAFYTGIVSIPGNSTINYPCDATSLIQVKADGTFSLRDALATKAVIFTPPMNVLKMCIWVGGDYKVGPKSESFTSILFKWPASQANKQWIEGPIAADQDRPNPKPNPLDNNPDDLECANAVSGPYAYIKGYGLPLLMFDVLDRSRAIQTHF
jgi:hypothetical protein